MTLATSPRTIDPSIQPEAIQEPLLLNVSNTVLFVTPEQFDELCIHNPDLRLELTQNGELIIMPPAFGGTGYRNVRLATQVDLWNERMGLGKVFDSSTGYNFTAFGGGKPSPDVSWIEMSRLEGTEIENQFIPIVPDFVIELRSASDNLKPLQNKMLEFQRLGVRLGLLIDPQKSQVEVYRLGQPTEILDCPHSVSCDDVLPGFILDLVRAGIWLKSPETAKKAIPTAEQLARDEGQRAMILRQLNRKLGELSLPNKARVEMWEADRLPELIDALLDFESQADLENWLLADTDCRPD
jgi:Uma2 family endonuclease